MSQLKCILSFIKSVLLTRKEIMMTQRIRNPMAIMKVSLIVFEAGGVVVGTNGC